MQPVIPPLLPRLLPLAMVAATVVVGYETWTALSAGLGAKGAEPGTAAEATTTRVEYVMPFVFVRDVRAALAFYALDCLLQYFSGWDVIGRPAWDNRLYCPNIVV